MNRCRTLSILVVLFAAAVLAFAQPKWKRVTAFKFDWNGHKDVQVVLEIPAPWGDPGDFTRIRIRVPEQREFTLSNKNGWVRYDSDAASASQDVRKLANLVPTKLILASRAAGNRTVLILFGYSYASSPGSLDVIELSDAGQPRLVLHQDEFGLQGVRDLNADGVAELIGYPCLSQEFGNGLLTYDPFHVYELGVTSATPATMSLPLSKAYNLKHYYGWAGDRCREDVAVILHPPKGGKPLLMSTAEAERLTSGKP
jgi:hypothetical protein